MLMRMRTLHRRASVTTTGALNFKDVMLAYGKLSREALAHEGGPPGIGFEFSGMVRLQMLLGNYIDVQLGHAAVPRHARLTRCPPCCTFCMQVGI